MPATAIDSAVFRDIFATEPMRRVFADENRVQRYLELEAALARVQARLGILPPAAAGTGSIPAPATRTTGSPAGCCSAR